MSLGLSALFVAFYASAEFSCFIELGWGRPVNILDLYVEFRNATNGLTLPMGRRLIGALAFYSLPFMDSVEKDAMRDLALRGAPWTDHESVALLHYCESDVSALGALLSAMENSIDLDRALLRGRYMWAAAEMERVGVPVDVELVVTLRNNWDGIVDQLVEKLNARYGIFEGRSFRSALFREYLEREGIEWPEDENGRLQLSDEVFSVQALRHPELMPLRVGRQALAKLRKVEIAVGVDGRNRTLLSPFSSKTGRNQPSTSKFVFGAPSWMRALIRPNPGRIVVYADWEQQEFGIAAALSGDRAMLDAYESGDPYLGFARLAGAVPPDATKASHGAQREIFKQCALGVLYGMTAFGLSSRIGRPLEAAKQLLRLHYRTFPRFWDWSNAAVCEGRLRGCLQTIFGWRLIVSDETSDRTLANFPMQANGAEMLRVAIWFAQERGVTVCAPVHDALLVEGRIDDEAGVIVATREAMAEASALVLGGVRLRTEALVVRSPNAFPVKDEAGIWNLVRAAIGSGEAAPARQDPSASAHPVHLISGGP